MRRAGLVLALLGSVALVVARAQERIPAGPPPGGPTFEVASIKRVTELRPGMSFDGSPGRWGMTNGSIAQLIRSAYESDTSELVGAPGWVDSERYDVMARAEGIPPRDEMTLMLRALLADRLKLAVHYEVQERPVYALVLARSDGRLGPQIRRSELDCAAVAAAGRGLPRDKYPQAANGAPACGMSMSGNTARLGGMPLATLARSISGATGRMIVDKTGLTGNYELTLTYSMQPRPDAPPDAPPSIFTAVQEQLGLKLESDRAPLRILVIDHVERPTED